MRGLRMGLGLTNVAATGGGADTTAPTLSSPVGTQTGSTTATIGATTDEGNGTMYGVVTTSSTAPTATQVKAGQNNGGTAAVFAGSVAVSSTGAKTISATGLTASTAYYAHIMHEDAAGNKSSVVSSAQFTTAAADPSSVSATHWGIMNTANKPYTDAGTTPVSADGDLIAQANDRSGSARHVSASSTERPTYRTASGGYAEFNGSNSLINASNFAIADGTGQCWFAMRAYVTSTGSWQTGLSFSDDSANSLLRLWAAQSGNAAAWSYDNANNPTGDSAGAVTAGTFCNIFVQVTSTTVEVWKDGTSNGSTALTGTRSTINGKMILGRGPFSTDRLTGALKGWAAGSGVLSSGNRAVIETWLSSL